MGVTTFDTLKFVRRLEEAGVPSEQAEAQAEVLTEAFNVNLEELVTKDYLTAQFAEQKAYADKRFAEQQAYTDKRFAEQQAYMDKRFAEQQGCMDKGFVEQKAYTDEKFAELNAKFTLLYWMGGLVIVVTVIPFLQSFFAL